MAEQTFASLIPQERERLQKAREDALRRQREIAEEISGIDDELYAIEQYEKAKGQGRQTAQRQPRRQSGKGGRSGIREQVLEIVSNAGDGMSASAVLEALQATEKNAKTSVRNALAALKKSGKLIHENDTYRAAQAA